MTCVHRKHHTRKEPLYTSKAFSNETAAVFYSEKRQRERETVNVELVNGL